MNIKVEGYSPDGFKVTLEGNVANFHAAQRFAQDALRAGFTPTAPDIGKRKNEIITTVIRREHIDEKGKVTPVVDLYPSWGVRDYGQFRFVGMYLNSEEDIRQFESRSGVKLADLPLYNGQNPWKRNQQRPASYEIKCKPFVAVKEYEGEKEIGGKMQQVWKFVRYGEMPTAAAPDPAPVAPPVQRPTLPAPSTKQAPRPAMQLPPPGQIRAATAPTSAIPINQAAPLGSKSS
jgi:hypothetical protein